MSKINESGTTAARVRDLLEIYTAADASPASLLCDRHDPAALAYRIVGADLAAIDLTYGELRVQSERFAAALHALGVRPGDRVATLLGKSHSYLIALMGIWRLGAVHVPLFTAFAPAAIAMRLQASGTRVIVCDEDQQGKLAPGEDMPTGAWQVVTTGSGGEGALAFAGLLAAHASGFPAARLGGDHPIIHIYTSGTTGRPKGVVVPTKALAAFHTYAEFALGLKPDDLYWCAADPGWAYGLYFGVLGTFTTATPSLLLTSNFSPEITFEALARFGVTNFAAAPTVYRSLRACGIQAPQGLRLRCASSAGEPLTPEVNDWAITALGVPVHDHYGQTEAGMLINNHHHPLLNRSIKPGSMGHAMPGWRAVVLHEKRDEEVDPGTLGRVAMVMEDSPLAWFQGYDGELEKSAEKFAGDGRWYITGDVGRADEDGYFHFSSRADDVIIMAGYRIGPFDVESVIALHPAVVECAVISVPDEVRGEVIETYVVLEQAYSPSEALALELQQWVKNRYAAHAYPRAVHFTSVLPKTPSGKVQRFVLKQQRRAELEAAQSVSGA